MRATEFLIEAAPRLHYKDFEVVVRPHSLNRARERNVDPHKVDSILNNLSTVKHSIMGLEPASKFILHDGKGTAGGFIRGNGNKLLLSTVYLTDPDFTKGRYPTFVVNTTTNSLSEDKNHFAKNRWSLIVTDNDKNNWSDNLIDLVHNAYKNTNLGSFVQNSHQVRASDWVAVDWDKDPDLDCTVFYRRSRGNEVWSGYKIQGIGHDGQPDSKQKVLNRVKNLLSKPGTWIESSDALARTLGKLGLQPVTDEQILNRLFPNTNLQMVDNRGTYERDAGGKRIREQVFGKPIVK